MLPKNPPQNNPPLGRKFPLPQRFGANKPGEKPVAQPGGKPTAKTTGGPLAGISTPRVAQPAVPSDKFSALQPLNIKPARQIEEGKENESLMIERLLKELGSFDYLRNKVAPATRTFWDDVKVRSQAQNNLSKSQLIADLRDLINKLESVG